MPKSSMDRIAKVIERYLHEEDTDYAIMINGEWGCGKTYFIEHQLNGILKGIKYNNKKDKKHDSYEKVYVSLYGASSKEDIESFIFRSLNPTWDRFLRYSTPFAQRLSGVMGRSWGEKIDRKLITKVNPYQVLVFDDLERVGESFKVQDALSVINSYTEHQGCKAIIICYEDKRADIQEYKEKSIRYTLSFVPDMSVVYDNIITGFDNEYAGFCKQKKDSVLRSMTLARTQNIRILKFILASFSEIYDRLKTSDFSDEILDEALLCYTLCSIESKMGATKENLKELDRETWRLDLRPERSSGQEEAVETYADKFWSLYKECEARFKYSEVLLDYIWDGNIDSYRFQLWKMGRESEFRKLHDTPQGKVYKKLYNISGLADAESPQLITEMFGYIQQDKYNLYDLMYIYALLLKFDHWKIDGFVLSYEHDKAIKESMDRIKPQHVFDNSFVMKIPVWDRNSVDRSITERYDKMKDYASGINCDVKVAQDIREHNEVLDYIEENDLAAARSLAQKYSGNLLKEFDWVRAGKIIKEGTSPQAVCLADIILGQLDFGLNPNGEDQVGKVLLPVVEETIEENPTSPRRMYLSELLENLRRYARVQ